MFYSSAKRYVQESALSHRVKEWQESIEPFLAEQVKNTWMSRKHRTRITESIFNYLTPRDILMSIVIVQSVISWVKSSVSSRKSGREIFQEI